jgi:hypothetical protein
LVHRLESDILFISFYTQQEDNVRDDKQEADDNRHAAVPYHSFAGSNILFRPSRYLGNTIKTPMEYIINPRVTLKTP